MNVRRIVRTFFTGLAVVAPILITVAVMLWLVGTIEAMLGAVLRALMPDEFYRRGLGLVFALIFIFAVGMLMEALLFRRLVSWFEALLDRIPLVKTVYGAVRDLMSLFAGTGKRSFSKVVMVRLPNSEIELIGFVTLEDFSRLPLGQGPDRVAVYMPMSYTIGGYTVFVPKSCLRPVDLSLEDAMRLAVTAGLSH